MKRRYLEGEQIVLRAVEPEDLDFLYRIENDPEMWDISCFTVPYSKYLLKEYIANNQYDVYADKQLRLIIQLRSDGTPIGTVDISDYSVQHERGAVGIALLKEYRHQKIGNEALTLLCEYAFHFLHFHQLYAEVASDNLASLSLFRDCHFKDSGILREWLFIESKWTDVIVLQRLAVIKDS
jgi:diamine N-acetyltransferase